MHDIFVSKNKDDHHYTFEEIIKKPLILLEKSSTRNYLDNFFAKKGLLLKPTIELGAHNLLLDFARTNLEYHVLLKNFLKIH